MRKLLIALLLAAACPWPVTAREPVNASTGVNVGPMDGERVMETPLPDIPKARNIAGAMANRRWMPKAETGRALAEPAAMHRK